jgi:PAS domain S-box-containing protein
MLQEHERSRQLLARWRPLAEAYIGGDRSSLPALGDAFSEYARLLKDHFWKENDILYPMALRVMNAADAEAVVAGLAAVEAERGRGTRERYYRLADELSAGILEDLSFGLERHVLAAMLNSLPVEISFVDADDRVRYFSHENQDKIFPRFRSAIGTSVQNCHPEKSLDKVKQILTDFREGRRTAAEFWIDFQGKKVHIRYFPVRNEAGQYLGCLEVVQDITAIQKLTGERRLLDV